MTAKPKEPMFKIVNTTETLKDAGIPVSVAVFQRTIQSYGANGGAGEPETALYDVEGRAKASRTATMYYTPHGLLVEQKFGTSLVPLANIAFVRIK